MKGTCCESQADIPNPPMVAYWKARSVKDYLVRARIPSLWFNNQEYIQLGFSDRVTTSPVTVIKGNFSITDAYTSLWRKDGIPPCWKIKGKLNRFQSSRFTTWSNNHIVKSAVLARQFVKKNLLNKWLSSPGALVTQWLEHVTVVPEVVDSIPTWNFDIFQLFLHPLPSNHHCVYIRCFPFCLIKYNRCHWWFCICQGKSTPCSNCGCGNTNCISIFC